MVPKKIKFATVDVHTGYLAYELSLKTLQVAVKENVDLLAPLVLSEEEELNETEILPGAANMGFIQPEKLNAVSNP